MFRSLTFTCLLLPMLFCAHGFARAQDLDCLSEPATLYANLQQASYDALDRRIERLQTLKSPEDIRDYQDRLRSFFVTQLGGFPDRTPLNAQTVRTIDAEGYRIENVLFESRPNHHITANVYVPDGDGPFPGIVVASGHSRTAKTADYNQRYGIMLARNGLAAICFDPIGQGERSQILDAEGRNKISGTTTEHFLVGVGSILVGRNTASYEVWDAMRCVDYLVSRSDIDPSKIGMTGCSGGGTQTSYVMALEPRIACAAPACYLTTFRRLIETIGPQDAEQNIFGQLAFGMDQPDYVLMRAPKPTLISSTTQDFFDIDGSWQNFRQAKQVYGRLGLPERVDLVEIEGKHGVTPQNLATITHWFSRWLLDRDQAVEAVLLDTRPAEDLLCTPRGQVLLLEDEKSVFDLNAIYDRDLTTNRERIQQQLSRTELRKRIGAKIQVDVDQMIVQHDSVHVGTVMRGSVKIEKHIIRRESRVPLPTLVLRPNEPDGSVCMVLDDEGKKGAIKDFEKIQSLLKQGSIVVLADLSGQGETSSGRDDKLLTNWKTFYLSYLLGKSIVGIRVEDTLAVTAFAASLGEDHARSVEVIAGGRTGIVALHAGALFPKRFAAIRLEEQLVSWSSLLQQSEPAGQLDHVVHGALELYDLPDLVGLARQQTATPGSN